MMQPAFESAGIPSNALLQGTVQSASTSGAVTPIHQMLYGLCDSLGAKFLMGGEPVSSAEVLSPSALLPAIAWMAQDAGSRLLQADFGCELKKTMEFEASLLGVRCVVPPVTGHIADLTRALFFAHFTVELLGLRKDSLIEVLPLYEVLRPIFVTHSRACRRSPGSRGACAQR